METYTKTLSSIHFLNDRNIAQELSGGIEFNPIPSLSLLNKVNIDLKNEIKESINSLDVEDSIDGVHKVITKLEEVDGKIKYTTANIISSDVGGLAENYVNKKDFTTTEITNDKGFTVPTDLSVYKKTDSDDYNIYIKLGDNIQHIDCKEFVKDGFLESVDVKGPDGGRYLEFIWNVDGGKQHTQIYVSELAHLYKSGEGIKIIDDSEIEIDDSVVITYDVLNPISSDVDRALKFDGTIEHYESDKDLVTLFRMNEGESHQDFIRNNSIYRVNIIEEGKYNLSSTFITTDGLEFTNTDYLIVRHSDPLKSKIPLS